MNFQHPRRIRLFAALFLPLTMFVALYVARLLNQDAPVVRLRQDDPRVALIGKWRSNSKGPSYYFYEFLPDGSYTERSCEWASVQPCVETWVTEVHYGHYQYPPDDKLSLVVDKAITGPSVAPSYAGSQIVKLHIMGSEAIADHRPNVQIETWYRSKQ